MIARLVGMTAFSRCVMIGLTLLLPCVANAGKGRPIVGRATMRAVGGSFPVTLSFERADLPYAKSHAFANQFYGGNVLRRGEESKLAETVRRKKTVLVFTTTTNVRRGTSYPIRFSIGISSPRRGETLLDHFRTQDPEDVLKLDWNLDHVLDRALQDAVHSFDRHALAK
jgi:hypothetical protein